MEPVRVLVIEDSAFMRKMIVEILESDPRITVLGTARNGKEGFKKITQLSPDVVTLDVEMPIMDGMTTLEKIMQTNPLPVVMLASRTAKESSIMIQAISKGAVDFITKPSGSISLDIHEIREEIVEKVIIASKANLATHNLPKSIPTPHMDRKKYEDTIVAIGASTGGPRALQKILADLPSNFPAPILIVQHMPANFTKSLAERLNSLSAISIKEATDGEKINQGVAYIAPGGFHMKVKHTNGSLFIQLTKVPENSIYRPSIDVLLDSVACLSHVNKLAIILTGMGRDGAKGIKNIKDKDSEAIILAESKESSIVYGMPKAARNTGYVSEIVHLHEISDRIISIVNRTRKV